MQEIEAKIALTKNESWLLERRICQIEPNDHRRQGIIERNLIYRTPQMQNGEFARLRFAKNSNWGGLQNDPTCIYNYKDIYFTYKGKNIGESVNNRQELQFRISDCEEFMDFLSALGFKLYSGYANKRVRTLVDGKINIFHDYVLPIGIEIKLEESGYVAVDSFDETKAKQFVEIEGPTETQVLEMVAKLNLQDKPIIHESYADMFAGDKNG